MPEPGEVPEMPGRRLLGIRGFDAGGFLRTSEVREGTALGPLLEDILSDTGIAHADIHFAGPGCFAARAMRVQ